ncbi:S8/S53 family peptidase [Dyella halodurans]|uniref:Protease pro-enzyme activation domain-containing protein n=1 Tax=Dyella halodurans TaxID=1920171 RepID=A0ABV9C350_9GAMM|nr:S53 family peptidase [Dyella halodurans]
MATSYVELPGSERPPNATAKRVGDADQQARVEVTIGLRGPALPGANDLPAKPLSLAEFEGKYASAKADADKVAQVLTSLNLQVEDISLAGRSMRVSGTVAAMEAAFGLKLGLYESATQGRYRGREGVIHVPSELKDIVTGVFGLDERRVARRKPKIGARAVGAPAPLGPSDLETRYAFPDGDAAGQRIAIAEFDGGYFPDDVSAYCNKFGRPIPQVTVIPVGKEALTLAQIKALPKAKQTAELDSSGEVLMDVQIVAGLCPGASIDVYFAPFTQKGWVDLLNKVTANGAGLPVALSVSWGMPEDDPSWSAAARAAINDRLQAAALLGITVCIAAGDDGSGDEIADGRAHVDFPSSSPFTLSVGGTMLVGSSTQATEEVWWESPGRRTSDGGGATGGGVSIYFERPSWQNVSVNSINNGSLPGRVIPDVAALAGPPYYDLIFLGQPSPSGGTSASTPLWAALLARIQSALPSHKPPQFLTPLLYGSQAGNPSLGVTACHDITVGQNASSPQPGQGYSAGQGYDAVSGWGTPIGTSLLTALS